jgi:hypothetical protein
MMCLMGSKEISGILLLPCSCLRAIEKSTTAGTIKTTIAAANAGYEEI